MTESVILTVDARGIATLTLNRGECHNAIDVDCARLLTANLETLVEDPDIRLVILTGAGISFSAGHDIAALRNQAQAPADTLERETRVVARLLTTLDTLPKPTIARVQGSAFGLGVGIICCCDFSIGVSDALFGFSEVRQGAIAAMSAPYVIRAIGARAARRYFLSTERFNAGKAKRLGLLHQDVSQAMLDSTVETLVRQLLINGPNAMMEIKRLVRELDNHPIDPALIELLVDRTVQTCTGAEGREGIEAFIEHRKPGWVK